MRGHVHKRGSTWTVVHDEPSPDGKRRQRSKGGFDTPRDATRYLTDALARIDGSTYASPSKLVLAEYLTDEWLPAVEGTLRPLSVTRYRAVVRLYVVPHIGHVRLQALSAGHLNGLYSQLEQDGLSVSTRRLVHAVLGRALRVAERWGASRATLPARPTRRHAGAAVRNRGRRASYVASSTTWRTTGCSRSGAWPPRLACGAASWQRSRGARSTSTLPGSLSSNSSCRPVAAPRSARQSRAGPGARSLSTLPRWRRCAITATHS